MGGGGKYGRIKESPQLVIIKDLMGRTPEWVGQPQDIHNVV